MKVIIAGGRDVFDFDAVSEAVKKSHYAISEVVSGGAQGADHLGEIYAAENNIPVKVFPANWDKHGRSAGPIRNGEMAEYADALIAIWDGKSRGTKNMIEQATEKGLQVYVYPVSKPRWFVGVTADNRTYIQDEDFKHDARFYVDGDFYTGKQKMAYVRMVCEILNEYNDRK